MNDVPAIAALSERTKLLSKHEVAAIGPMLRLVEQLIADAGRQYDRTAATVLTEVCDRLIRSIETAIDQDRWIPVKRAALTVRRPEGTVRYWCRHDLVIARRVGGRGWEIDRDSLYRRAAT